MTSAWIVGVGFFLLGPLLCLVGYWMGRTHAVDNVDPEKRALWAAHALQARHQRDPLSRKHAMIVSMEDGTQRIFTATASGGGARLWMVDEATARKLGVLV